MRFSKSLYLALALSVPILTMAQNATSTGALDVVLSEAYSVYTEVISILSSAGAPPSTSTPSSNLASTTSTSATSSLSSRTSSVHTTRLPTNTTIPSSITETIAAAATSATTTAASSEDRSNHNHRNLVIILGSVLGALGLGFLLLFFVLCCRHRRHHNISPRRPLSLDSDEFESWRLNPSDEPLNSATGGMNAVAAVSHHYPPHPHRLSADVRVGMAEHSLYRCGNITNPFVPVPPAPRGSIPNLRSGLEDEAPPFQPGYHTDSHTPLISHTGSGTDNASAAEIGEHTPRITTTPHDPALERGLERLKGRRGSMLRKPVRGSMDDKRWSSVTDVLAAGETGDTFEHQGAASNPYACQSYMPAEYQKPLLGAAAASSLKRANTTHHTDAGDGQCTSQKHERYSPGLVLQGVPQYSTNEAFSPIEERLAPGPPEIPMRSPKRACFSDTPLHGPYHRDAGDGYDSSNGMPGGWRSSTGHQRLRLSDMSVREKDMDWERQRDPGWGRERGRFAIGGRGRRSTENYVVGQAF